MVEIGTLEALDRILQYPGARPSVEVVDPGRNSFHGTLETAILLEPAGKALDVGDPASQGLLEEEVRLDLTPGLFCRG